MAHLAATTSWTWSSQRPESDPVRAGYRLLHEVGAVVAIAAATMWAQDSSCPLTVGRRSMRAEDSSRPDTVLLGGSELADRVGHSARCPQAAPARRLRSGSSARPPHQGFPTPNPAATSRPPANDQPVRRPDPNNRLLCSELRADVTVGHQIRAHTQADRGIDDARPHSSDPPARSPGPPRVRCGPPRSETRCSTTPKRDRSNAQHRSRPRGSAAEPPADPHRSPAPMPGYADADSHRWPTTATHRSASPAP